jgi:hypothetical protein
MISNIEFEVEVKLKDGRLVSATGVAKVGHSCDCAGDSHDHVYDVAVQDIVPLYDAGSFDGPEIIEGSRAMHEIELAAEREVYRELEEAS